MSFGLVELAATVLLAAGLGAIGWLALRARRPAVAHTLFLLALLELLVPPLLPVSVLPLPTAAPATSVTVAAAAEAAGLLAPGPVVGSARLPILGPRAGDAGEPTKGPSAAAAPASVAPPPPATPAVMPRAPAFAVGHGLDGTHVLLLLWASGSVLVALTLWRRARAFARATRGLRPAPAALQAELQALLPRLGLSRAPELCLVDAAVPPMVCLARGRARVLLPARRLDGLPRAAVRALLAHELAHVRRRDPWLHVLEALATVAWWWLPVLWWLRAGLRTAEERCCDAWVAMVLPEAREDYCRALLAVAAADPELPMPALATPARRCRNWKDRLEDIMCREIPPRTSIRCRLLTVLLAVAVLPLASSLRAQERGGAPIDVDAQLAQTVQVAFDDAKLDEWCRWFAQQTGVPFAPAASARQADPGRTTLQGLQLPAMPASRALDVVAAITDLRWRATDREVVVEAVPAAASTDVALRRVSDDAARIRELLAEKGLGAAGDDKAAAAPAEAQEPHCSVFGAVPRGGELSFRRGETVFELLARCGWTTDANLGRLYLIRPDATDPLTIAVDLREVILTGRLTPNVVLRDGDILFVTPREPQPQPKEPQAQAPLRLAVGSRLQFVLYCDLTQPGCEKLRLLEEPQTVAADGTIFVPYVGNLQVLGRDREQVAALVQTALRPMFVAEMKLHARFLEPSQPQQESRLGVGSRLQFVFDRDLTQPGCEPLRGLAVPLTIGSDGTILVPYIGWWRVVGLTRQEVAAGLQAMLQPVLNRMTLQVHAVILDDPK